MTVKEVLQISISELENIKIPVGLIGEIGTVLARTAANLRECVRAIEENEPKSEEEGADVQA